MAVLIFKISGHNILLMLLQRLEYVDLSGNNFMQIHHHSFQVLRDLKTLNLSNSQVHSIETSESIYSLSSNYFRN